MILVDVELTLPDRASALPELLRLAEAARRALGNLHYRVLLDAERSDRLHLSQGWSDMAAFEAYMASDTFAALRAHLSPRLSGPPISRRYRIEADAVLP